MKEGSPQVTLQTKSYTIRNSITEMLPPSAGQVWGIVLSYHNLVLPKNEDTSDSALTKQSPQITQQTKSYTMRINITEMLTPSAGQN